MPYPSNQEIAKALLQVLVDFGGAASPQQTYPKVAEFFPELTEADLNAVLPNNPGTRTWWNKVQWQRQNLLDAGYIDGSVYNLWKITDEGRNHLRMNPPMAHLYELFVAEWLREHLPKRYTLQAQANVTFSEANKLRFIIDLVICDLQTGQPICVLDTKYKCPDTPASDDVSQVVTYAEIKGCTNAILIYPQELETNLDARCPALGRQRPCIPRAKFRQHCSISYSALLGVRFPN